MTTKKRDIEHKYTDIFIKIQVTDSFGNTLTENLSQSWLNRIDLSKILEYILDAVENVMNDD